MSLHCVRDQEAERGAQHLRCVALTVWAVEVCHGPLLEKLREAHQPQSGQGCAV